MQALQWTCTWRASSSPAACRSSISRGQRRVGDGADVRGHEDIELARGLDLPAGRLERHQSDLGQRNAHLTSPSPEGRWSSRTRRASAIRASWLGEEGLGKRDGIEAVGENGPQPGVLEPANRLVGVRGRVDAVREVEHAGDAGVERLERADVVAGIDVLGAELGRDC